MGVSFGVGRLEVRIYGCMAVLGLAGEDIWVAVLEWSGSR